MHTQLHPQNEEVLFITASFGGDVKPSVPRSWLILATCAIPASSLATFGKNTCRKKIIDILEFSNLGITFYTKHHF